MEYCMDSVDINFTIKAENCKAALAALNKWAEKKYSSLQHGLTDLGWSAENISNGDVAIFLFDGERLHGANIMFEILAPHVAEGSYISMHGQDNEYWQWYFDGKKLIKKPGRLVFGQNPKGKAMSYTTKIISYHEDLPKELKIRYESSVCTIAGTTYLEGDILLVYHGGKLLFDEHSQIEPEDVSFTRDLDWVPKRLEEAYRLGLKDGIRSKNK